MVSTSKAGIMFGTKLYMVPIPIITAFSGQGMKELEFNVIFGYLVSSRPGYKESLTIKEKQNRTKWC